MPTACLITALDLVVCTWRFFDLRHPCAPRSLSRIGQPSGLLDQAGVKRVCIPNRSTKSAERRREQKKRWFRNGQKWRTGCEGRISVIKRRHGLTRCRYKADVGMQRWVGLGVVADNLVNIGRAMQEQARPQPSPSTFRRSPAGRPPVGLAA